MMNSQGSPTTKKSTWFVFLFLVVAISTVDAFHSAPVFQSTRPWQAATTTTTPRRSHPCRLSRSTRNDSEKGFGSSNNNDNNKNDKDSKTTTQTATNNSSPAGEFAFQEMLVLLTAMQKQGATSRTMDPAKRIELEGYIETVLATRTGLPLRDMGKALLPPSQWKLLFSTSPAVVESLPSDATLFLTLVDHENLDYTLRFSKKTLGLESITAKCKYTVDSGPVQPGLLTFVYDKITTNILGFQNVGVGFFGLLQGRTNYVETAYFDGTFWIERGVSGGTTTSSDSFVNVYMRTDD